MVVSQASAPVEQNQSLNSLSQTIVIPVESVLNLFASLFRRS